MGSKRNCGRCGLPGLNGGVCPVFQKPMEWDGPGCPIFQIEVITCATCGNPILPVENAIFKADSKGDYHLLCDKCIVALRTCAGCENAKSCAFENNPRPDKYIMRTVRQGNAQIQMQVRNPEIVRDTCQKECKCFSEEFGCLRENNCCGNHNTVLEDYLINGK